jgi:hypothetical protein
LGISRYVSYLGKEWRWRRWVRIEPPRAMKPRPESSSTLGRNPGPSGVCDPGSFTSSSRSWSAWTGTEPARCSMSPAVAAGRSWRRRGDLRRCREAWRAAATSLRLRHLVGHAEPALRERGRPRSTALCRCERAVSALPRRLVRCRDVHRRLPPLSEATRCSCGAPTSAAAGRRIVDRRNL